MAKREPDYPTMVRQLSLPVVSFDDRVTGLLRAQGVRVDDTEEHPEYAATVGEGQKTLYEYLVAEGLVKEEDQE